jgi:hypothetical protein
MDEQTKKVKQRLAVAGALILALSGMSKLLKDNAQEERSALSAAKEHYENAVAQSNLSRDLLLKQAYATDAKARRINSLPAKNRDYSQVIEEHFQTTRNFFSDYRRNYEAVTKLVDALPADFYYIKEERDATEPDVLATGKEIQKSANSEVQGPKGFSEIQTLGNKALNLDARTLGFGERVIVAAEKAIEKREREVKLFNLGINIFVPLGLAFGIVAALWGVKLEGPE